MNVRLRAPTKRPRKTTMGRALISLAREDRNALQDDHDCRSITQSGTRIDLARIALRNFKSNWRRLRRSALVRIWDEITQSGAQIIYERRESR